MRVGPFEKSFARRSGTKPAPEGRRPNGPLGPSNGCTPSRVDHILKVSLSFTDPGLDLNPSLPLDALNKLLTFYCYSPPHSVRPSDLYRALALESEKTLFHPAPPGELLFFVLLHYLDFVYDRHKDAIAAERLSKCITTLF